MMAHLTQPQNNLSPLPDSTPPHEIHYLTQPPPFRPIFILLAGVLFGAVGAGLLAAINWVRLGESKRLLPMVVLTVAIIPFIVVAVIVLTGGVGLWINWIITWLLSIFYSEWQKPAYNRWLAEHGKDRVTLAQSGYGVILMVVITAIALTIFYTQLAATLFI
jgi:hypothetical protein